MKKGKKNIVSCTAFISFHYIALLNHPLPMIILHTDFLKCEKTQITKNYISAKYFPVSLIKIYGQSLDFIEQFLSLLALAFELRNLKILYSFIHII